MKGNLMVTETETQTSSLRVERSIRIQAPVETVFQSLLEQLGPAGQMPDGTPMSMKFEAWPGGRWLRDLGNDSGHLWGHVQVIKPPTLIEIAGPLFMSYPAISHVQYRLIEQGDGTELQFCHRAIGEIEPDHRDGVEKGWDHQLDQVRERAE